MWKSRESIVGFFQYVYQAVCVNTIDQIYFALLTASCIQNARMHLR